MAVKKATASFNVTLEELLEAGCHFGHEVKRWNPKMAPYIYTEREGVHVFDLAKTREGIIEAYKAIVDTVATGGTVLFVGTKRQAKDLVKDAALKVGMPYVTVRWLGGVLTNFEQMRRSIKKLGQMKAEREEGKFKDRTKLERLLIDREIANLERLFGGIATLSKLPDMLFIVGTHEEGTAVREAVRMGVPICGIVDTNSDPTIIDYPIPANDDAVKSISLIVDVIAKAVEEGKEKANKVSNVNKANEKQD
ncbi:MAG: 30S ribosomal protein S2 [bacterium]|nr:30S ribosomal protein S2 [bacterium]